MKSDDKIRLLVDKPNLTYPPGTVLERYDGTELKVPDIFKAGSIGYINIRCGDGAYDITMREDSDEFGEHLGQVIAAEDEIELVESMNFPRKINP